MTRQLVDRGGAIGSRSNGNRSARCGSLALLLGLVGCGHSSPRDTGTQNSQLARFGTERSAGVSADLGALATSARHAGMIANPTDTDPVALGAPGTNGVS